MMYLWDLVPQVHHYMCVLILLQMSPYTTISASSYYYICVLILLYVSSYYNTCAYYKCVLIRGPTGCPGEDTHTGVLPCVCPHTPIYMCPHTPIYVSSYSYMCPHTPTYVSSYSCSCVLILLCKRPHIPTCVFVYVWDAVAPRRRRLCCSSVAAVACAVASSGATCGTRLLHGGGGSSLGTAAA